ncbi:MAG TPA: hypothetical protein DHV39_05220, partial [Verrucomicrobiales bacterium]|nr:hypothetical protein [Verrucomicrobiales bacterium]
MLQSYHRQVWQLLACSCLLALFAGCSVKKLAIRQVGNAFAGTGTSFASDNDPELIREALPFSLKLMESLLAEIPDHQPLLLSTSSAYSQYAYAFLQMDADRLEDLDFRQSQALRKRAANLFVRARDYGLQGLEVDHSGFAVLLRADPKTAVLNLR